MAQAKKKLSPKTKTKKALRYAKGFTRHHSKKIRPVVKETKEKIKNIPVITVIKVVGKKAHQGARDLVSAKAVDIGKGKLQKKVYYITVKSTQALGQTNPGERAHELIEEFEKLGYKHSRLAGQRAEKYVYRKLTPVKKKALRAEKRITRDVALYATKKATEKVAPGMKGWGDA